MEIREKYAEYLALILKELKLIKVSKVLVFGSYTSDHLHEDSDIDLLIVLNNRETPETYDEWLRLRAMVRRRLRAINLKVPLDLLVFTIPQYEYLMQNMNSFYREIHETGIVLYEKAS